MSKENGNGGKAAEEPLFDIGQTIKGYKLVKKIDEGGFGKVFKVSDDDGKTFCAMKLEPDNLEGGSAIKAEANALKHLPTGNVFPSMKCFGRRPKFHFLVMELLGDNLKVLKARSPNPDAFSDGTWSRVGIQCLYALKMMHDYGFVHRDIKPANFAVALNSAARKIMLFDFGLARRFVKQQEEPIVVVKAAPSRTIQKTTMTKTTVGGPMKKGGKKAAGTEAKQDGATKKIRNRLIAPKVTNKANNNNNNNSMKTVEEKEKAVTFKFRKARPSTDFRGTDMYASPNAHALKDLGRADDVWSLMYMIAELFVELPWTGDSPIPVEDMKNQATLLRVYTDDRRPDRLTAQMEKQLDAIEAMLRAANYYQHPNYELVHVFLKEVMTKSNATWNSAYDWESTKSTEEQLAARKQNDAPWELPGPFFKIDKWANLKAPSPPTSTKKSPQARNDRGTKKLSKESTTNNDDDEAGNPSKTRAQSVNKTKSGVTVEAKKSRNFKRDGE
ncbi:unnamed protein product [Caenorhabditis sp. 36 PRJEB53466]|nr:unnamed protein product [Caenorhabditis sp. 36 PRJEB53466]